MRGTPWPQFTTLARWGRKLRRTSCQLPRGSPLRIYWLLPPHYSLKTQPGEEGLLGDQERFEEMGRRLGALN